ncbi:hypothetical protein HYPSUDRAFT_1029599 [Hypholoma sublateritium FD-334 SS-4]|uniref:Uncharacterized protein n=1 Tax=Hypholoma sublateritium (strain FD-334 SS-4) TaxID=945553 RepID=A0A0D2PDY5_HYPSF|nr:hypothetical protein HYPSUDRAFT_1029599 [Hypholoma sublateritium FD-334 SS-4]
MTVRNFGLRAHELRRWHWRIDIQYSGLAHSWSSLLTHRHLSKQRKWNSPKMYAQNDSLCRPLARRDVLSFTSHTFSSARLTKTLVRYRTGPKYKIHKIARVAGKAAAGNLRRGYIFLSNLAYTYATLDLNDLHKACVSGTHFPPFSVGLSSWYFLIPRLLI